MTCSSEQTVIREGSILKTGYGTLEVQSFLGKGKSGYSWLVQAPECKAVLKIMHDEEVSYYSFSGSKLAAEIMSYRKLMDTGIKMPGLYFYDEQNGLLIKEYIDGETGSRIIAEGKADEDILKSLCSMYLKVKSTGLNIDYFPSNFVISRRELYYIDYECNPYDYEWGLENWGLYYWVNTEGMKRFLAEGDSSSINMPGTGQPLKSGLSDKVSEAINKFLK
ncbi:MAG: hypothetical protein HUU43_08830 [Ignavibacteriaceae bacterium]|nr:hypothetical protein [Ignavibacteriaceae bacterium]